MSTASCQSERIFSAICLSALSVILLRSIFDGCKVLIWGPDFGASTAFGVVASGSDMIGSSVFKDVVKTIRFIYLERHMLVQSPTRDERINQAYSIVRRELLKYRRHISFPKNTDPRKTYSWRYLEKFVDRVDSLELSDLSLETIISALVREAAETRTLQRGMAVLDNKNMLLICQTKLESEVQSENAEIRAVSESHAFVLGSVGERNDLSVHKVLTERTSRFAYANITRWFEANQLAAGYIAVSRSCKKALGTLPKHELELFPAATKLMRLRLTMTCNNATLMRLRTILGNDLYEE